MAADCFSNAPTKTAGAQCARRGLRAQANCATAGRRIAPETPWISTGAKTFTCCLAHFLVVRKLLRPAQRTFCPFENFYTPPNAIFSHSKTLTTCPTKFQLIRKTLCLAKRNFCSFENFYSLPRLFSAYKILGKWLPACCRSRRFPCIFYVQSLIPIQCRNGGNYRDCTF